MQHELLFQNPVFQPGLNVTVRRGSKWMKDTSWGDELLIKKTGQNETIATGELVGRIFVRFKDLPANLLQLEHDPSCRTLPDLFTGMKQAYPGFIETDLVTALLFLIY